ncbi:MAG: hypothetical protein ACRC6E_15140 [Fusobacteriaceae bacterium]
MDSLKTVSQEDNLIVQTYSTMALLINLQQVNFLESEYYKNKISDRDILMKTSLEKTGEIDGQGALLLAFYTYLVIPKELLSTRYKAELSKINKFIMNIDGMEYETEYPNEQKGEEIDYIKHIRNAISHCNVEFDPKKTVSFKDQHPYDKSIYSCLKIPLKSIGEILSKLQHLIFNHVKTTYSKK